MPKYRDNFLLDIEDIELIEQALRQHASKIDRGGQSDGGAAAGPCPKRIQRLLGKLHGQKIFYSQTHASCAPNG